MRRGRLPKNRGGCYLHVVTGGVFWWDRVLHTDKLGTVGGEGEQIVPRSIACIPSMVVGIAGFALYWPSLRQFELGSLMGGYAHRDTAGTLVLVAVLVAMLVFCGAAMMARRRIEPLFAQPSGPAVLVACSGSWGALLLMGAPACGVLAGPLALLGAACMALGYLALTLAWALVLLEREPWWALTVVAVGYALGEFAPLLDLAGEPFAQGFTLLASVGSAVAWRFCSLTAQGAAQKSQTNYAFKALRNLPLLLVTMIALFLFVGRVAVGAFIPINAQIDLPVRLIDAAVALLFMGVLVWSRRPKNPLAWDTLLKSCWVFLALMVIAGLLLAGASWNLALGEGLVAAGFNCFELFLWVLLMRLARERNLSVTLVFCGVFSLCKVVPVFCGKLLAPQVAQAFGDQANDARAAFLLIMVFLLVAATFWFLAFGGRIWEPANNDGAHTPSRASMKSAALDDRMGRYGLTPREIEVVGYVLNGYSYQKTADLMGVSLSTVQSHVKNLYRKLGVHTKDELVEWAVG